MKTQIFSFIVLLLLTGAILSFAKNNPAGYITKIIKTVQYNVNESQNTDLVGSAKSIENCAKKSGVWYPNEKLCEANHLSEMDCKAQGGEFNGCASACRHDPKAEMCTLQCVLTCTFR